MKTLIHRYLTLILSLVALVATTGAFASDTLTDFVKLQRSGVSEDVIVAWAAKQPPVEPTKEAMDTLIQSKVSGRVAQALLVGNSRPGYVPPKAVAQAQPVEAVQQPAQPDDNVVIQPVARDVPPDTTVVVDGGVTYYPDAYADWPYGWSPYWNFGTYGYWGWHNGHHNGWHDGRNGGWSGYHSGQFNSVRHEQSPARTQSLPQTQTHIAHSYVPAQDHAVTSHQSYSGTVYSHGNTGGYSGGHSYSGGGYSGGHSYSGGGFSGGHSFGGGGHGGGRR